MRCTRRQGRRCDVRESLQPRRREVRRQWKVLEVAINGRQPPHTEFSKGVPDAVRELHGVPSPANIYLALIRFVLDFCTVSNADQDSHILGQVPQERLSFHGVPLRWRRSAAVFHDFERRRKDMEHSSSYADSGWRGAQTVCLAEPR